MLKTAGHDTKLKRFTNKNEYGNKKSGICHFVLPKYKDQALEQPKSWLKM